VPAPKIELTLAEKAREWAGENILKPGMTGKLVEVVQWALMLKDYDVILIDGIFGDVTKKQIIKFQADMGLVTDGYVGPVTLEALMK
jgi:peptidoglycan hydrolase-like protein with peptidoglycan-binding domain